MSTCLTDLQQLFFYKFDLVTLIPEVKFEMSYFSVLLDNKAVTTCIVPGAIHTGTACFTSSEPLSRQTQVDLQLLRLIQSPELTLS